MNSVYIGVKTFDELAELQDSALALRIRTIRQQIDNDRSKNFSAQKLEVEFCYAQREFDVRALRSHVHKSWKR